MDYTLDKDQLLAMIQEGIGAKVSEKPKPKQTLAWVGGKSKGEGLKSQPLYSLSQIVAKAASSLPYKKMITVTQFPFDSYLNAESMFGGYKGLKGNKNKINACQYYLGWSNEFLAKKAGVKTSDVSNAKSGTCSNKVAQDIFVALNDGLKAKSTSPTIMTADVPIPPPETVTSPSSLSVHTFLPYKVFTGGYGGAFQQGLADLLLTHGYLLNPPGLFCCLACANKAGSGWIPVLNILYHLHDLLLKELGLALADLVLGTAPPKKGVELEVGIAKVKAYLQELIIKKANISDFSKLAPLNYDNGKCYTWEGHWNYPMKFSAQSDAGEFYCAASAFEKWSGFSYLETIMLAGLDYQEMGSFNNGKFYGAFYHLDAFQTAINKTIEYMKIKGLGPYTLTNPSPAVEWVAKEGDDKDQGSAWDAMMTLAKEMKASASKTGAALAEAAACEAGVSEAIAKATEVSHEAATIKADWIKPTAKPLNAALAVYVNVINLSNLLVNDIIVDLVVENKDGLIYALTGLRHRLDEVLNKMKEKE